MVNNSSSQTVFTVSNNRVGIGTSSPDGQLTVVNLDSSQDIVTIKGSDSSTVMVIDDSGNVGIGVDSPSEKLVVAGTISANIISATTVSANTLNVGDGMLYVDGVKSQIGVGTCLLYTSDAADE